MAAQRVTRRHGFESDEFALPALVYAGARHGLKALGLHLLQAQRLGALPKKVGRRAVAGDHRVAAKQLARITLQAALQAVGKKAHRRERRHRQRDGQHQKAQLAGAHIAPQAAPAQGGERRRHGAATSGRTSGWPAK